MHLEHINEGVPKLGHDFPQSLVLDCGIARPGPLAKEGYVKMKPARAQKKC